jgi:8-oxo-dGTP diphosphatase
MIRYTLGFVFDSTLTRVLLIHKLRPEAQRGLINGLGGKFEEGETAYECVAREILEEAGLVTLPDEWTKICDLGSDTWNMDVLALAYQGAESDAQTAEDQEIEWFNIYPLPGTIKSNLAWLIPLCRDALDKKEFKQFSVKYHV